MPEEPYVPALGFHSLTGLYDPVVRATTREGTFKTRLLRRAAIKSGERVLDVGCGTGTLAIRAKVSEPGADVVGIDGDPEMLMRARKKARRERVHVDFDEALSTDLPYQAGVFEVVVSTLFFHHLGDDQKLATVQEIVRVLKPGGRLVVADWGRASDPLMGLASWGVRILDGVAQTGANFRGELPEIFESGGLRDVIEVDKLRTMFGSLALYEARAPGFYAM